MRTRDVDAAGRPGCAEAGLAIVGGGAAGLLAAIAAGGAGAPVVLLERNPGLGIKIAMSGGGRGNVTNAGDIRHLVEAFPGNGKFLWRAFSRFGPEDLRRLLADQGVETRVEDRGRVFPSSGRAKDVVAALERTARAAGAGVVLGATVQGVTPAERRDRPGFLVTIPGGRSWIAERVILTTGGVSYPKTGSTGDGLDWARCLGHTIVPLRPALVGLETSEAWPAKVSGVALRGVAPAGDGAASGRAPSGVEVTVRAAGRVWARDRNDALFTHFGLSGPAVLNVSRRAVAAGEAHPGGVEIGIRVDPDAGAEKWRERWEARVNENPRRQVKNLFEGWWPASLAEVLCAEAGVYPETQVAQLPRAAREQLGAWLYELRFGLKGPRPLAEATVTAGGVSLDEVDPKTLESHLVPGLYFAGEILDVDGISGGYNLQAAFSTGWLAGESAAGSLASPP